MKTALIIAAVLVGVALLLVAIVAGIGATLPKAHVTRRSAVYRQSPEVLFATITDFAAAPSWRSDLQRVELLGAPGGLPRFREHGRHDSIEMEVVEMAPPRRLVVRIADPNLPFGGRWVYELAPMEQGTRLAITEEGEIYNPIFRFVARFILGTHGTLEAYLRSLGRRFGEEVAIGDTRASDRPPGRD